MKALLRHQLLATAAALLCACLTVFSAARLFGELSAMGPLKAMEQWAWDGRMGSHAQRQRQLSRLLMSLRVAPWSADRHMDLARFYIWHMHQAGRRSRQHEIYAERSQRQILEALQQRPVWGFAWASLAQNSVASGRYDPLIEPLLERALRYGPYEPGTLRTIALVGMLHWREFPQPVRAEILTAVRRSLKIDDRPINLIRLAFSLQWQEQLRPLLQTPAQRIEYRHLLQRQKS